MNYQQIKDLALDANTTVKELIALTPNNDPFYIGKPAELRAAKWFAFQWAKFDYDTGVHLRRVHYQIVSMGDVDRPIGASGFAPYVNDDTSWGYLVNAGKYARYLGLVSPDAFVDRRNPDAIINANWDEPDCNGDPPNPEPRFFVDNEWENEHTAGVYDAFELPALASLQSSLPSEPDISAEGYLDVQQAVHIEIWCEKTTMNDILEPLCGQYRVNLVTGAGEMSITSVVDFMRRVEKAGRPARILYISDYDPAGHAMPVSVSRKIEFFQRNDGYGHLDIRLESIVLTAAQVSEFDLPRIPVKSSDKRKAKWQLTQGEGAVELDALEALHPGEFRKIVERHILNYFDTDLQDSACAALREYEALLEEQRELVTGYFEDDIEEINTKYDGLNRDWSALQDEFSELVRPLKDRLSDFNQRLAEIVEGHKTLCDRIAKDIFDAAQDVDAPAVPKADLPDENGTLLYNSYRGYIDQLSIYKFHKLGGNDAN